MMHLKNMANDTYYILDVDAMKHLLVDVQKGKTCLWFSPRLCKKLSVVHGEHMMNLSTVKYVNPPGFQLGTFREQRSGDSYMGFTFVIICRTHIFIF